MGVAPWCNATAEPYGSSSTVVERWMGGEPIVAEPVVRNGLRVIKGSADSAFSGLVISLLILGLRV